RLRLRELPGYHAGSRPPRVCPDDAHDHACSNTGGGRMAHAERHGGVRAAAPIARGDTRLSGGGAMMRGAAQLVATVGLMTSASAQVNWETHIGFAQSTNGPLLAGNTLTVTATGVYTFIVRVGIFSVTGLGTGQANHGLAEWTATASAGGMYPG